MVRNMYYISFLNKFNMKLPLNASNDHSVASKRKTCSTNNKYRNKTRDN